MAGQSVDLRPAIVNLLLYAGDGFSIKLACADEDGAPIDITGSVMAQIRHDRLAPTDPPLAIFGVSLVDAYLGFVSVSLTGVQTQSLVAPGAANFEGTWDVQWNPPDREPRTLVQGLVECVADVTR